MPKLRILSPPCNGILLRSLICAERKGGLALTHLQDSGASNREYHISSTLKERSTVDCQESFDGRYSDYSALCQPKMSRDMRRRTLPTKSDNLHPLFGAMPTNNTGGMAYESNGGIFKNSVNCGTDHRIQAAPVLTGGVKMTM